MNVKKLAGLAKNEGTKFAKMAKEQQYVIGNLKIIDNNGEINVSKEIMEQCLEECKKRTPESGYFLITTCETETKVLIYDPNNESRACDWLNSTSMKTEQTTNNTVYVLKGMTEGEYYKFRDQIVQEAFTWLEKNGFMVEESDEEVYEFEL